MCAFLGGGRAKNRLQRIIWAHCDNHLVEGKDIAWVSSHFDQGADAAFLRIVLRGYHVPVF